MSGQPSGHKIYLRNFSLRSMHISVVEAIVLVTYIAIVVLTTLQVFSRYVLGNSIPWTEELARYCFMWLIYVGMVLGLHRGTHASVDVLADNLKGVPRTMVVVCVHLISIALFGVLCYQGFLLFLMVDGQATPAMRISMMIPYFSLPFGAALMIIEECWIIKEILTKARGGKQ